MEAHMTSRYFLDRIAARDPHLRAADADRERAAEQLRQGHAEGRLDLDEFQQRLERCYASKTMGELDSLLSDLPRQPPRDERRLLPLRPWRVRLALFAAVLLGASVLSGSAGHHHVFLLWIGVFLVLWRVSWRRRRWWWSPPRRG
jgi:Domain of unknown function (DUF1707)